MSKPEDGLLIEAWAIIKINTVITLSVLSVRPLLVSGGYLVYYLNLSVQLHLGVGVCCSSFLDLWPQF